MKIVMDPEGLSISRRKITLSTAGVVPMIRRCGAELGVNLAISLHAVSDEVRDRLVPLNRKYPIAELLDACRTYPGANNARRITFEYVMLKGVNDSPAEARELVRLIAGIPAKVNLIPFNPWPGAPYECSTDAAIAAFSDIVFAAGYSAPVRTPRGRDIFAACGQLKSASVGLRRQSGARAAPPRLLIIQPVLDPLLWLRARRLWRHRRRALFVSAPAALSPRPHPSGAGRSGDARCRRSRDDRQRWPDAVLMVPAAIRRAADHRLFSRQWGPYWLSRRTPALFRARGLRSTARGISRLCRQSRLALRARFVFADGEAALDFLAARAVAPDRIVLWGESLGIGRRGLFGRTSEGLPAVIFEAPFTSVAAAAQRHYPFVPAALLVHDRFDSLARIGRITAPLLVMHGQRRGGSNPARATKTSPSSAPSTWRCPSSTAAFANPSPNPSPLSSIPIS